MQYLSDTLDTFSLQNLGQTIGTFGSQLHNSLKDIAGVGGGEQKQPLEVFRAKWDEIYLCYKNDGFVRDQQLMELSNLLLSQVDISGSIISPVTEYFLKERIFESMVAIAMTNAKDGSTHSDTMKAVLQVAANIVKLVSSTVISHPSVYPSLVNLLELASPESGYLTQLVQTVINKNKLYPFLTKFYIQKGIKPGEMEYVVLNSLHTIYVQGGPHKRNAMKALLSLTQTMTDANLDHCRHQNLVLAIVEDLVTYFSMLPFLIDSTNVVLELSSMLRHVGFCSALLSGATFKQFKECFLSTFYEQFLKTAVKSKLVFSNPDVANATIVYLREILKQTILSKSKLRAQIVSFLFQEQATEDVYVIDLLCTFLTHSHPVLGANTLRFLSTLMNVNDPLIHHYLLANFGSKDSLTPFILESWTALYNPIEEVNSVKAESTEVDSRRVSKDRSRDSPANGEFLSVSNDPSQSTTSTASSTTASLQHPTTSTGISQSSPSSSSYLASASTSSVLSSPSITPSPSSHVLTLVSPQPPVQILPIRANFAPLFASSSPPVSSAALHSNHVVLSPLLSQTLSSNLLPATLTAAVPSINQDAEFLYIVGAIRASAKLHVNMFSPHHHSRPEPLPVYSIPTLRHELLACLREMESQSPERNLFLTDVLTKLMQYPDEQIHSYFCSSGYVPDEDNFLKLLLDKKTMFANQCTSFQLQRVDEIKGNEDYELGEDLALENYVIFREFCKEAFFSLAQMSGALKKLTAAREHSVATSPSQTIPFVAPDSLTVQLQQPATLGNVVSTDQPTPIPTCVVSEPEQQPVRDSQNSSGGA